MAVVMTAQILYFIFISLWPPKNWVAALHEVSHGPATVTTKLLKQCGR